MSGSCVINEIGDSQTLDGLDGHISLPQRCFLSIFIVSAHTSLEQLTSL